MASWPYYTEPTHDQGSTASATRTTDISGSSGEDRLVRDVDDKIFLLKPFSHPLLTLLTNIGKRFDGETWQGVGLLKKPTSNPVFDCNKIFVSV